MYAELWKDKYYLSVISKKASVHTKKQYTDYKVKQLVLATRYCTTPKLTLQLQQRHLVLLVLGTMKKIIQRGISKFD